MQVKYDLKDINDISSLVEEVDIKELSDLSGITLNGKALNKQQKKDLRHNIMKTVDQNSNYGKKVSKAIGNAIEKMEAIYIDIADIYSAPRRWNFYEQLDDDKKIELIESIESNGILSPIIVWDIPYKDIENEYGSDETDNYDLKGNKYVILAGHNRADAFNKLYKATKDDKYLKIPAFIFKNNELTIKDAREIVVDTNYVQRVLSVKEMEKSIIYKYDEVENDKTKKGRTREIVASMLGISPAKVAQYKALSEMYPPLKEMVYSNDLALTSILKISDKGLETQKLIYETYSDKLSNKILNKVKPYMKWTDIQKLFDKELQPKIKTKKVAIEVPEDLMDEFKEMAYQWIYNKTKR